MKGEVRQRHTRVVFCVSEQWPTHTYASRHRDHHHHNHHHHKQQQHHPPSRLTSSCSASSSGVYPIKSRWLASTSAFSSTCSPHHCLSATLCMPEPQRKKPAPVHEEEHSASNRCEGRTDLTHSRMPAEGRRVQRTPAALRERCQRQSRRQSRASLAARVGGSQGSPDALAPDCSNFSTTSMCPFQHAQCSGVQRDASVTSMSCNSHQHSQGANTVRQLAKDTS